MGGRYKLRGAYLILQLIFAFILIGVFVIAGVFSSTDVVDSYRDSLVQQEGEALDKALKLYSKEHFTTYPTGENDERGDPISNAYGIYPTDASELSFQIKYGFISSLISGKLKEWSTHGDDALDGDFYYEVSADRRAYLLQAKLTSGYIYTTPGSLSTIKELTGATTVGSTVSSSKGEWGSSISGKSKN